MVEEIVMWHPDAAQIITDYMIGQQCTPYQEMLSYNMENPYLSVSLRILCPRHVTVSTEFQNTAYT